ncbi:MAG: thiamine phosphate synthase [Planctomycetes bacterium]|nr:thiamine phosphate synthase [Planctomycetota bacterium]
MKSLEFVLITDRKACKSDMLDIIVPAIEGGVSTVQLREKDLSTKDLYAVAEKLRKITEDRGVNLVINDRVDIALAVDADGVHLGWQSLSVGLVRRMVGGEKFIGFSAHSLHEAQKAAIDGVDYVSISPVYHTLSKCASIKPLNVLEMRRIKEQISIPLVALGGINEFNVKEVLENGADGVAVISALFRSERPKQAARRMHDIIKSFNP